MIAMKVRARLLEPLYWATLAAATTLWLTIAPLAWESARVMATFPGAGEVVFTLAGVFFLTRRWMRRHTWTRAAAPLGERTPQEIEHTARHEAAHAVVAWSLGAHVTEISTARTEVSQGHCSLAPRPEKPLADERWLLLRVCMASTVIEHQDRQQGRGGCSSDLAQSLAHAATIIAAGERPTGYAGAMTIEALLSRATDDARDLLTQHVHLLEALAERVGGGLTWWDPDLAALERETRGVELVTT